MDPTGLSQIVAALEAVHNPRSSSEDRRQAQDFLETIKHHDQSPFWGWQLAVADNPHVVKHFGLTLLQHAIQYDFLQYDQQRKMAVRNWIVELVMKVQQSDPHYLKEKLAFLWVAVAKRVWGSISLPTSKNSTEVDEIDENDTVPKIVEEEGWQSMDQMLLELWNLNSTTREMSLIIFRTLFEDLYMLDDPIAAKRGSILSALSVEVVTSNDVLEAVYDTRMEALKNCRSGTEGWLDRWSTFLAECLNANTQESEIFAIKVLQTLKTCLHWIFPAALRQANLLETLSNALTIFDSVQIQTLATDCLHSLFTRNYTNDEDFKAIVGVVFMKQGIETLSNVYENCNVNPNSIDEKIYSLLKKLVEMIVGLGEYLNVSSQLPKNSDIESYLKLVLNTSNHPSLIISGLSLQFWCSVLRVDYLAEKPEVLSLLPSLLKLASERIINYKDVPDDNISKLYLSIDFDSTPDMNLFLGNYKRFMDDIVRLSVCRNPIDGILYLESKMIDFFTSDLGNEVLSLQKLQYNGNPSYFLAYAQLVLIEAGLRGVSRWKVWYTGSNREEIKNKLDKMIEEWCNRLLEIKINDPMLLRKQIQTLVQFTPLLKHVLQLMFVVLEKVLTTCTYENSIENESDDDRELIRDLRTSCGTELNRLAYMMPEALVQIYDDLERVIAEIIGSSKLTDHEAVAFKSFLLVVSQRSSIDSKEEKFSKIVDPELNAWTEDGTMKGLMRLPWFMERLGIVRIAEYFRKRGITAETDLLNSMMDQEGKNLKAELKSKWSALFPIRATRIYIQYTIEKLDHESKEYKDLLNLWKPRVQQIIPHILQLISQIQAYHNPNNWKDLPQEVQSFVKYSCMERFWQVGVSIQSKDTFVEENVKAMHTLRDFADSVGHIIRYTREYAFLTVGSITQLEETLYEIPGIGSQLWLALAGDSAGITSHAWRHIVNIVVRSVIKNCPQNNIYSFMKDFLPPMLRQLDYVLLEKWSKVYSNGVLLEGDEDDTTLSEEMMEEHLLRQLTAIVARMLIDLSGQINGRYSNNEHTNSIRDVIIKEKEILAPFLTLITHILLFKDTRCSFNACLILRNILSKILLIDDEVDAFLCNDLMKGCLTVITDPYFQDVHNEAAYVLTTIYVTLRQKSDQPAIILTNFLNSNITSRQLEEFERRLSNCKNLRQQRGSFLEFLSMANNVMENQERNDFQSREDHQKQEAIKHAREKLLVEASKRKKKDGFDVMDDPFVEDGALSNLFHS